MTVLNVIDSGGTPRSLVVKQDSAGNYIPINNSDSTIATYRYVKLGFTPVASPTDFLVIQGSASKTIRIKSIGLFGFATAQGNMPIQWMRRSTAGTLGTAVLTALTAFEHDPVPDPAPTAVVSTVGTANYTTLGTLVALGGAGRLNLAAVTTGSAVAALTWNFCRNQDKAIVLRGVSDFICLNANAVALPAGTAIDIEIEMEEDAS